MVAEARDNDGWGSWESKGTRLPDPTELAQGWEPRGSPLSRSPSRGKDGDAEF